MKKDRHQLILRLIEENNLSTQSDLLEKLKENGINATQATISRDIKDLRLIKKTDENGVSRYAVDSGDTTELVGKYKSIFEHSVVNVENAGNMVAVKCYVGMAQAACAALDSMHWDGLIGTIAGDDTIFALCKTVESADKMKDSINNILRK